MTSEATFESSAQLATAMLREVFAGLDHGFTIRLWDGSELELGRTLHPLVISVPTARAFKRLMLNPTAAEFGESYCDGDIDLIGDLFDAMSVADSMEDVDITAWEKFKVWIRVMRLTE